MADNTGLDATGLKKLISLIKTNMSAIGHKHSASDITSGTLPVAQGGTNATTAADARKNLMSGLDEYVTTDGYDFVLSKDTNDGSIGTIGIDGVKEQMLRETYNLSGGYSMSDNTDLDTLTTIGNYVCNLDTTAATVTNSPTGGKAFMLKVGDTLGDGKYPYQEATRYTDGASWRRTYNRASSVWNAWGSTSLATARKVLWSGTWSAGGIQVNGIQDYSVFAIYSSLNTIMIGFMNYDKSSINCYGIICPERNVMKLESATIAVSGNQLVRTMPRSWTLTGTAISSADGALSISRIEGLF